MDLGGAQRAVCQTSGSYLFPSTSLGNALVHLNTDMTMFVGDHVFFSLNGNAMCVIFFFFLKRKAQGSSASGYKMIPGPIPGSKQVEYTSPRLISAISSMSVRIQRLLAIGHPDLTQTQ